MRTIGQALAEILPAFRPRGRTRLPLQAARGLFLAEELLAREDSPPFANSAMDGWAVHSLDLAGARPDAPVVLPARGESRAGGEPPSPLAPRTAMRIFTGAPLPPGADAVVMQEDVEVRGEELRFVEPAPPGRHVRGRGEDLRAGARLLREGSLLGPGELGLLASQGHVQATVWRRPVVAILTTGDELRDPGEPARPGTIVNSNAPALAAAVEEAGGVARVLPNAPDRREAIARAVEEGLAADVLVTVGGVSVGEYDLVREALEAAGVELGLWRVAMKPGKPLTFGRRGDVPVLGLPGNPVSALVGFEVFVRPGLRRMLGDPAPFRPRVLVELAAEHRHSTGRLELARAGLERRDGRLLARLHARQGSGSLPSVVATDAYVLLDADRERFEAGERLPALALEGRAAEPPFGLEEGAAGGHDHGHGHRCD